MIQSLFLNLFTETERAAKAELEMKDLVPEEEWEEIQPEKYDRNWKIAQAIRTSVRVNNDSGSAGSCFGCFR
jgi:hypothetical protein